MNRNPNASDNDATCKQSRGSACCMNKGGESGMAEATVTDDIGKNTRVVMDYNTLSELQKTQFRRVIMEGLNRRSPQE